jgi:hypothetical protein
MARPAASLEESAHRICTMGYTAESYGQDPTTFIWDPVSPNMIPGYILFL